MTIWSCWIPTAVDRSIFFIDQGIWDKNYVCANSTLVRFCFTYGMIPWNHILSKYLVWYFRFICKTSRYYVSCVSAKWSFQQYNSLCVINNWKLIKWFGRMSGDGDQVPWYGVTSLKWDSYQIRKNAGAGNAGTTLSPPPRVSDPDMDHGTCVAHVPWCMPGSLTSGFLWSRSRGKRSRHYRRMHNPQLYVAGKRPMGWQCHCCRVAWTMRSLQQGSIVLTWIKYNPSMDELLHPL